MVNTTILTRERLKIIEALQGGGELMLSYGCNKKGVRIGWKSGKNINQDVALGMLKHGMLVPSSNDGLFAGQGQTLGLSATLREQLKQGV